MSNLDRSKKLKVLNEVRDAKLFGEQGVLGRTMRLTKKQSNKEIRQNLRFLVGVDEAGRGPLAGPVSIGIAVVPFDFDWDLLPGVKDSKKVAPKRREEIYARARELKRKHVINYAVSLISASTIDRVGITKAVAMGIDRAFRKLSMKPEQVMVKLDGLLKAPPEFVFQETIIKGDSKEKVIGLASILAKVTRDRTMVRHARHHPQYAFEAHKGYGTELHYEAIKLHGFSSLHRLSFCKNIVIGGKRAA